MLPVAPTLPVADGGNGGVAPATPASGGVETTPAPASVPATTTQPSSDGEDLRAQLEADRAKAQADLNALKSSLQSQISDVQKARDQERRTLEGEIHKLRMSSMDEPARKDYELTMVRGELTDLKAQLETERSRAADLGSVGSLVASFGRMGIPSTMLDLEHGPEALAESGWRAVGQKMTYLENAVRGIQAKTPQASPAPGPGPTAPQPPGSITPPPVAPPAGGPVTTGRTWGAVLKSLGDQTGSPWTEEDVYRAVENGRLPANILPGLENMPSKG